MSNAISRPIVSASVIWRGKWFIIASMGLALSAAVFYLQRAEPVYEAGARLLVRQKGLQFDTQNSFLKDRQFLATEAQILRSEPVLRRVLQTVNPRLPERYTEDPLTLVLDSFTVTPSPVAEVLTMNYRSSREEDAVAMIRAAIDSYRELLRESEGSVYEATVKVLSNREQKLREEIAALQTKYHELRESGPLVGHGGQTLGLHTQQLTSLGDRLATARGRKFEIEKKLESFVRFKERDPEAIKFVVLREFGGKLPGPNGGAPLSDMHDVVSLSYTGFGDVALQNSAAAQMFRQQAESKLNQMHNVERQYWLVMAEKKRMSLKASHPTERKVEEELEHWERLVSERHDDWRSFLNEQVDALSNVLQQELETAERAEQKLDILYNETRDRAKKMDSFLLREQIVEGNITRVEKVHETMLARLADFELADQAVAGGRASADVRVLEGPELSSRLVWPLPPLVVAGSLLIGCLVPVALLAMFARR